MKVICVGVVDKRQVGRMSRKNNSIDKVVECPFYHWSSPNRICCEGITDDNTTNLIFGDPTDRKEYMRHYCCNLSKYNQCVICQILNRKYGDSNGA